MTFVTALACLAADKSGIDRSGMDPNCKPCQDFWRYANGTWLDKNPIPARYARWGTMTILNEANRERMKTILEAAAGNAEAKPGSIEKKVGDIYGSCMDTTAIDIQGAKPVQAELERIARIGDRKDLKDVITYLQRYPTIGPFEVAAQVDLKNSEEMIVDVDAGGLSLPDRDYYFKDDQRTKQIREEFIKHVERMFLLLGDSQQAAARAAGVVLALETSFAQASFTNVQRRDPYASYHKMDVAGLSAAAPSYDWKALFNSLDIPPSTPVNLSQPEFIKTVDKHLNSTSIEDWKTWLRWRVIHSSANYLSAPFFNENFRFNGTVLTGAKEPLPRWQICANVADNTIGFGLGELYVEKYFPPAAKQRMLDLVENLRATLREELEQADWLEAQTKKNAVTKLNAFVAKIGYPDKWRDYTSLQTSRKSYFANVREAGLHERRRRLARIGKPIDKTEWSMTPPTVNAYYSPVRNEIAFPAGILQPPFFDMEADDAANYGAIGAVIGHEMGHGFDDQGSKFDAGGNLKNWWTAEDRKKFEARAACVIEQFNTLDVGEGLRHNGKLVVGEALGDLGGLTLAYKAYKRSLRGKPEPPVMDGFTAGQRFFLAFGRVWAVQDTPEGMRLRLNTDPHPLGKFRANGTLQNMPDFHQAFGCKQGDPMVRPPESRCKLW